MSGKNVKSLKKLYSILTLILISIGIFAKSTDTYSDKILSFGKGNRETRERADSIMHLVIEKATQYQNTVSKYEAEIYIKGRTEIFRAGGAPVGLRMVSGKDAALP